LSEEQVEQMDQNSEVNFIINKLNESSKFHLKRTITSKKFDVIHKIIDRLWELDSKKNKKEVFQIRRQKSVELYNIIEKYVNTVVERYNLFETDFTEKMWLVVLFIIQDCIENNLDFEDIIVKLDISTISNNIQFKNYPTITNYRYLREVINNVK
jgi:hypothetical protein